MDVSVWTHATRIHQHLFDDLGDVRVKDWPFMANPYVLFIITYIYIYWIIDIGPRYMFKRKPYNIKPIIQVYNVLQVVASFYVFYQILTSAFLGPLSVGCEPVDYSNDPLAMKLLTICWYSTLQKTLEYVETVFFILRKKNNQASGLHIYHHVSTAAISWIATKYVGGGMVMFPYMLNSFIHTVMYFYYFLSSLGPQVQQKIGKWKKYLTIMQMVQFVIIVLHSISALSVDCDVPKGLLWLYIPNVLLVFYLFYNFYRAAYIERPAAEHEHTKREKEE